MISLSLYIYIYIWGFDDHFANYDFRNKPLVSFKAISCQRGEIQVFFFNSRGFEFIVGEIIINPHDYYYYCYYYHY